MATLSVWKFDTPEGAQKAEEALIALSKQNLIEVQDAAVVYWEPGKNKPKTKQAINLTGAGALGGTFWGLLFGMIFLIPLIGAAVGAAVGALTGSLTDVGINDDFIASVRQKVTPGTSALFALTSGAVVDRVHEALKEQGITGELISSNLSEEQESKLREVFAD